MRLGLIGFDNVAGYLEDGLLSLASRWSWQRQANG